MKKYIVIGAVVVAIVAGAIFFINKDCKGDQCEVNITAPSPTPTTQLTVVEQANKDLNNGGILVDVRTPEEFAESHAKDAVNLPLSDLEQGIYPSVDKSQPVYVYCRSGNRSNQAKTILEQAGFTNVIDVGGLADWQAQGGEVISRL